jgi:hypothetical protein
MTTCPKCGTRYGATQRLCPHDGTVLEPDESAEDKQVGKVLDGKYRLDSYLSRGGMGAVYRATHVMLGRPVAVKLINPDLVTSPDIVRRFQREARAVTHLTHPNIVAIYDLGQTEDGTLYIAMELVSGQSLSAMIKSTGPFPPDRIVRILGQVASALALAHRNHIVHRDLKPHNLMVSQDEEGLDVAKLLDFGIAKTFDIDANTQLTTTGSVFGTPQYMSPEQASGLEVDARSDLYSLGIILYEMLSGEVPFSDPSMPAVLIKHISEAPVPPSQRRPGLQVSPALEAIALRCLEKDPAKRFQTAGEFGAELQRVPVSPQTAPPVALDVTLAATALPTRAVPASAAADADATPPLGVTVQAPGRVTASPPPKISVTAPPPVHQPPVTQKKRSLLGIAAGIGLLVVAGGALALFAIRNRNAQAAPPPVQVVARTAPAPEPVAPIAAAAAPATSAQPTPAPPPITTPAGTPEPRPAPAATPAAPVAAKPAAAAANPATTAATTAVVPAARPAAPAATARAVPAAIPAAAPAAPPVASAPTPAPAPAPAAAPVAARPEPAAPEGPPLSFTKVKMTVPGSDGLKDYDVRMTLANGQVSAVSAKTPSISKSIPYRSIVSATYSESKNPRWKEAVGGAAALAGLPSMSVSFLKSTKHWLTLQAKDDYILLQLDKDDVTSVLLALQSRTGISVERLQGDK